MLPKHWKEGGLKALDEEGAATVQREKEEREKREMEEAEQKANGLTEEPRPTRGFLGVLWRWAA